MSRDKSTNLSNSQEISLSDNPVVAEIPLDPPLRKVETDRLEKSILSSIVYYDCMDYPLTLVEIFRYLVCSNSNNPDPSSRCHSESASRRTKNPTLYSMGSFGRRPQDDSKKETFLTPPLKKGAGGISEIKLVDIINTLEAGEILKKHINQKNGFYFLAGRENLVEKRIWRKKLADEKWKKIKPTLMLCQAIPYVRAIFISGSLALSNTKKESDIDILVIAKHGKIWTARAFLTVFLSLLGKYRRANSTADKICANHYITNKSLPIPFPSLYNAQTYAHFFAADGESAKRLKKFKESNAWIADYLANFDTTDNLNMHNISVDSSLFTAAYVSTRKILEFILDYSIGAALENRFKNFESNRIKKSGLYNKSGGRITISDEQLEFHPDSPEKAIVEKFNAKMRGLGFPELANLEDSGLTP